MPKIAIIGGTGFTERLKEIKSVETDYGVINVGTLKIGDKEILFIARHANSEVPPLVNYKGNIQALALEGVRFIYAVSAGGRLGDAVLPGHLVAIDDFDWDDARIPSFADVSGITLHVPMSPPVSPYLHQRLTESGSILEQKIGELYGSNPKVHCGFHSNGTYFNIEGPGFSPSSREARIRATIKNPAIIGQTLAKEAYLAREMGIAFAGLAMCTDHSCYPGGEPVNHETEVMGRIGLTSKAAYLLLEEAVRNTDEDFYEPRSHDTLRTFYISPSELEKLGKERPHLAKIIFRERGIVSPKLAEYLEAYAGSGGGK